MTEQTNSTPNLYALLIGIDCYLPNVLQDGASYKSLKGCVRDITHVEAFLKRQFNLPSQRIYKLTASNVDGSFEPSEPPEQLPTYESIVGKFKEITEKAQPQDQVYIHYSGHGGRAVTNYPELKGVKGFDEALVPTDIGNPKARYLRDLELAELLQRMVDKELLVTVVLDSCHSGGATRSGVFDSGIRGINRQVIDTTPRSTQSLVASAEELAATWQALTAGQEKTRNVTASSGWLPEPQGYVLLAACRDNEFAYEYAFNGKERNGALTYWLLDSLQLLGTGVSYEVLHNRIIAKVHTQFQLQTPMLQGEGNRLVFNGQALSSQLTVTVITVDMAKKRILLQAGEPQSLSKGAEFAIYALGTTDFTQTNKRVALAKIVELDAEKSWAEITGILGTGKIEDGASAILLSPGVKLIRKVRLLPPKQEQPSGISARAALAAVKAAKATVEGNGWVEILSEDEFSDENVTYYVSVNANGEYEILDPGGEPIANLRPLLKVSAPDAAARVVNRLVHLSKYHATLQLENNDPLSPLAGKLNVELCKVGENRQLKPFNAPGNVPTLEVDEYAVLRIRNESDPVLNITVLAIQPDWSIAQLHPYGAAAFEPLDPGREKLIRIRTSLPDGYTEGTDILKVFATVGATSFRWLELSPLDQPRTGKQGMKASNPLEELLAAFAAEQPPTKNVSAAAYPSEKWTTEQVKLVVRKIN